MPYKPKYDEDAIASESTCINVSGKSPQENVRIEEGNQRAVAESDQWLLAAHLPAGFFNGPDSRELLESHGFIVGERQELFYTVQPPEGWRKETSGYWTYIYDETGKECLQMFYKGAWYDSRAFIRAS